MLEEYLKYSVEKQAVLVIKKVKGNEFPIIVNSFNNEKVFYNFQNQKQGQIWRKNIEKVHFKTNEDEEVVRYRILNRKYHKSNIKDIIINFKNYYSEVLNLLQQKEEKEKGKDSQEYKYYNTKKAIYEQIFQEIASDLDNLLLSYFLGVKEENKINEVSTIDEDVTLLLQQSNQSQKKAIKTVLRDKVSLIEGPPGTGKTTTIINLIANLLYRNKKVLIVSKNNSAIDNVVEELDKMRLPKCYIRLGNKDVMKQLSKDIDDRIEEYSEQIKEIKEINISEEMKNLKLLITKLNEKEDRLNELIKEKGELNELENQLRHVSKKNDAYSISNYETTLKRSYNRMQNFNSIKNKIEYLAKILIKISEDEKINFLEKILTHIKLNYSIKDIEEDGVKLHLALEEKYLNRLIESKRKILESENIDNLKRQIEELYLQEYVKYSKKITMQSIFKNSNLELIDKIKCKISLYKKATSEEQNNVQLQEKINDVKDDLLTLYPVIMATVDSVLNFYKYFQGDSKVDYVIIDEASQCDILSALPLLYIAKNIVVVGDSKQLRAIVNLDSEKIINSVEKDYNYIEETFLSTILKVIAPKPNVLMEHYRCDYNIINYCNKYFYDNKLIIYKEAKEDAMSIIDVDKGKYVTKEEGKFVNYREIETIDGLIQGNIENKFIITPFRGQADKLEDKYNKSQCGTIHTFQGKGEKEVYVSTVLNETQDSIKHLKSNRNLFNKELINVAVSRAKNKFVLVTDRKFFKKYDKNVRDLIEYIETYGKEIPDKTVCIFDYLYKQIHSYQITDNCSNIYEKALRDYLIKYTNINKEYTIKTKLPLAELITDKKFLNENPEIKKFILNENTHTDFVIYKSEINKPVLVIELDGEKHEEPIQIKRDEKKNMALKHMEIRLWRIKSKAVFTLEEFNNELDSYLKDEE